MLGNLHVSVRATADAWSADVKKIQREGRELEKTFKPITKSLDDMGRAMMTAGKAMTVAFTAPILAVAGVGIAFNAMQEQAHIAFTTMLGDGAKATKFLNELKDFAARTPFEFPDLVRAAQRLMAMGFAADEVRPLLTAVGNAVAGLGGGAAEIDRVTLALGQMQGRGRIATQEMNQLTEVGIPAWRMLAEGMGVTEAALRDMVEKGMVPAGRGVEILVAGMNSEFGGMMEKQATTFNGLVSTIKDESRFLAAELTTGLFNALKGPAESFMVVLHDLRIGMSGWSDSTKAAIAVIGLLAAAMGPLLIVAGALASSISKLMILYTQLPAILLTVKLAVTGLGAAFVALGPGAIAVAMLALVALTYKIAEATGLIDGLAKKIAQWTGMMEAADKANRETSVGLERNIAILKNKYNVEVDRAGKTTQQLTEETAKLMRSAVGLKTVQEQTAAATRKAADASELQAAALTEAETAAKAFRGEIDSYKSSVTGSVASSKALNAALIEMKTAGVNGGVVLKALGQKALETAQDLRAMGLAVPQAINTIAMAQLTSQVAAIIATNNKHLQEVEALTTESYQKTLDANSKALSEALDNNIEAYKKEATHRNNLQTEEQQRLLAKADEAYEAMLEIERRLAGVRKSNADERVKDEERVAKAGQDIVDKFADSMSKLFIDGITHGKTFWESFKNFGKNAIASIADTFIATMIQGVLKQFESEFGKLQANITKMLSQNMRAVGMIAGGAAIGAAATGGSRSGTIAGAAGGAALNFALQGNWVAASIAGIVAVGAALTGLIGRGRRMANEFVQNFQNPLEKSMGELFGALEASQRMGTLTVQEVGAATVAFEDMWTKFQASAATYGVVGEQALATLTPFVAAWREGLQTMAATAAEMEHMSAVMEIVNRVMGAADGWQIMEQGIQHLMDTGMDWSVILEIMGGDVRTMAANMDLLGIAIPPAMRALLDAGDAVDQFAEDARIAAEAMESAGNRLKDVESELASVREQVGEALLRKFEYLEGEIETSSNSIDKWRNEITGLNEEISDAARKLADTKYWQEQYNSLISDQADEVKRLLDLRMSTEERILALGIQVERDKYAAAIEAAKLSKDELGLAALERNLDQFEAGIRRSERSARAAELTRLQNELPNIINLQEQAARAMLDVESAARKEITARQQELKTFIDNKAAERTALQALITVEKDRIKVLEADKVATKALMDLMGVVRLSELQQINATIDALVSRGIELEAERTALADLLDVAKESADVFNDLAAAIGDAALAASGPENIPGPAIPSPVSTPSDRWAALRASGRIPPGFEAGLDRVPQTMPVLVHQGEAILNKSDAADWRSGRGIVNNYNNTPSIVIHVHESNNPKATVKAAIDEVERLLTTGQSNGQGNLKKTVQHLTRQPNRNR